MVATASFTRVTSREGAAVSPVSLASGLACRAYEGDWRTLPDFAAVAPTGSFTSTAIGLPTDRPMVRFGMVCRGLRAVPADGLYTFWLQSSDSSQLLVDGETVVTNDSIDFISRHRQAALRAGLHPVELPCVYRTFVAGLELTMGSESIERSRVTPERLFH